MVGDRLFNPQLAANFNKCEITKTRIHRPGANFWGSGRVNTDITNLGAKRVEEGWGYVSASPVANDPKAIISVTEFRRDAGTCGAS